MTEFDYATSQFSASRSRLARMTSAVRAIPDLAVPMRVLDIGCGTGGQLLDLLQSFPEATGVGIDISVTNVETAARTAQTASGRVRFLCADYLVTPAQQYDIIISDSVLQWFDADDSVLAAKLAADLAPGGHLLATIPAECLYNRLLATVRRGATRLRRPSLDRLMLASATVIHRDYPRDLLRQRVEYMYLLPRRYGGPRLWNALTTEGLRLVSWGWLEHASLGQMRHGLLVARREE
jgi:trans-aconitate methyltransferase